VPAPTSSRGREKVAELLASGGFFWLDLDQPDQDDLDHPAHGLADRLLRPELRWLVRSIGGWQAFVGLGAGTELVALAILELVTARTNFVYPG
jgi:hypothetical protein